MEVRDDQQVPVCNLTIRDHHSFAVSDEAVLVHNAGWCTYLEKLRPKPVALLKQVDDGLIDSVQIHAHHIVMKGDFSHSTEANRKFVTDAQEILTKNGIGVMKTTGDLAVAAAAKSQVANMCWAVNGAKGIHSAAYAKAVFKKLEAVQFDGAGAIEEALRDMARILESGERFW